MKTKIYLYLRNTEKNFTFFKYFETEYEKDKFKAKLKYIPYLMLIEDSTDMVWSSWKYSFQSHYLLISSERNK